MIRLYTGELHSRLRTISHRECAEIADVEARYRAEAGTEKTEEIYACLDEGSRRLASRCYRFLADEYTIEKDNLTSLPEAYVYDFTFSERRALGKADPLAEAMNTFILEYALAKFYSNVSQSELSNKHSLLAIDAGNLISGLLFTKKPPRV